MHPEGTLTTEFLETFDWEKAMRKLLGALCLLLLLSAPVCAKEQSVVSEDVRTEEWTSNYYLLKDV